MPDRGFHSGSSRSEPITLTPRRSACIWICFRPKSGRDALAFVPQTTGRSSRQIVDHGWLEILAYHEVCCPKLATEWVKWKDQRPFVGPIRSR
jgi:hypothetical protein